MYCEEPVKTIALRTGAAMLAGVALNASAQIGTEWRVGYLECGRTHVRALAECYAGTSHCISETLSFQRGDRRVRVGLHARYEPRDIRKVPVQALDYHAAAWTCVAGAAGETYVLVSLARATGTACPECAYQRLFDLNGRLVASTVTFDSRGEARPNDSGRAAIERVVRNSEPRDATAIYR